MTPDSPWLSESGEGEKTRPQQQTAGGEWVPSIPLPLYVGLFTKCRCQCGRRFRSEQKYRDHWAQEHSRV